MALRWIDGFEDVASGDLGKYYVLSGSPTVPSATPRNGAGYLSCTSQSISKVLDAQPTWIVGFGWRIIALPASTEHLVQILDGATLHVDLRLDASNRIQVTRNGTVLGTSTTALLASIWYFIELKVTISDSAGVAVLRINGVPEVNLSGIDTRNAGNPTADTIRIPGTVGGITSLFDDVYICDGTGAGPDNDFLGDCAVESLLPNGNGNSSAFVGSDADSVNNYLLVDEAAPNGDADYVESSTVGAKDTYTYGDLVHTSGTVYGVMVCPVAEKTDAGARSIVTVARLAGNEVDGPVQGLTQASYLGLPDVRTAKPGGGTWSISDVNSAEFGQKVNA